MDIFHSHPFWHCQGTHGCSPKLAAAVNAFCGFPFCHSEVAAFNDRHGEAERLEQASRPLHRFLTHPQQSGDGLVGGGHTTAGAQVGRGTVRVRNA